MSEPMTLERLRPTIPYQAAALDVTVMLASAALSFAERHTRGPIEQAIAEDTRRSLGEVLPQGSYDNDPGSDRLDARDGNVPVVVHIARKAGVPTAVVLETAAKGYSGEIGLVVGIDREGRVTGVRITRHTETPGLGDKVEVTGSDDKGVYWRAGDEVIIEDCEIHKNHGSPALNLEYVSRSGLPSSRAGNGPSAGCSPCVWPGPTKAGSGWRSWMPVT